MPFAFVLENGTAVSDGRGGQLVYRDRRAAERVRAELEHRLKVKVSLREVPVYGNARYGQDKSR